MFRSRQTLANSRTRFDDLLVRATLKFSRAVLGDQEFGVAANHPVQPEVYLGRFLVTHVR